MASNQDNKKSRGTTAQQTAEKSGKPTTRRSTSDHPRGAATITAVVPVQALASAQWDQDGDDTLAAALRVFFLSHTLDPLTGEVHTVH